MLYRVVYIASPCQKLHTLKECTTLKMEWASENISILDVGASPIENPVASVATLLFLMPSVKEI